MKPGIAFSHHQGTWTLADGHPNQGTYVGTDFFKWPTNQLAGAYWKWNEVVTDSIDSSNGGIGLGEYPFPYEPNGPS